MTYSWGSSLKIIAAIALLGVEGAAIAQAEPEGPDDIVVTARKRGEKLMDVPIAISAVNAAGLQSRGIQSINQIGVAIPNVRIPANNGGTQASGVYAYGMRGIVTNARNIGFEPGVGTYVDGVYVSRASAFNQVLSDIDRVEVLRGPQGTLFGKNTIAGAINIITREPTDTLTGVVTGAVGNRNAWRGEAFLAGPLTEGVKFKLSAYRSKKDGDIENVFDGTKYLNADDTTSLRGALHFDLTSSLRVKLAADYTYADTTGAGLQLARMSGLALSVPGAIANDRRKLNIDGQFGTPAFSKRKEWGTSATVELDLPNHQITSITAYRDTILHFASDDDATPWPIQYSNFKDSAEGFSQELRLASTGSHFWNYVVGAFYFNQVAKADRFTLAARPDAFTGTPSYPIYNSRPTTFGRISVLARVKTEAWALFASNDFKLSDALSLTVGLRYTEERKSLDDTQRDTSWVGFPSLNIVGLSRKDSDISGNASLSYKVTPDALLYATVGRGFKSGGFNPDYISTAVTFAPEQVTSYEIGAKADLFDRLLRVNAAAFYIDYADQQVNTYIDRAFFIQNAGKSKVKGVEAEVTLRPVEGLTLNGTVGYVDPTFSQFANCRGPNTSCAGNRLPYVSNWTGFASAEYSIPLTSGTLSPRVEWAYTGDMFFDPQNNAHNHIGGYGLVNGNLTYQRDDGIRISLWAKNLLNKSYDAGRWDLLTPFGIYYRMPGETRTYGAEFTYRF